MAKQRNRRNPVNAAPTPFEEARDELFQHIMSCGVIGAASEHQSDWFRDTMDYLSERYPELSAEKIGELRTLGERFAQPPKTNPTAAPDAETADAA